MALARREWEDFSPITPGFAGWAERPVSSAANGPRFSPPANCINRGQIRWPPERPLASCPARHEADGFYAPAERTRFIKNASKRRSITTSAVSELVVSLFAFAREHDDRP